VRSKDAGELVAALTPEPLIVEAAWSASRAPGPLRAFYRRIATRRGFQVAVVARARGMTVLFWHLITKDQDYAFARPGLNAHNGPIGRHATGVRALMRRSPQRADRPRWARHARREPTAPE